MKRSTLLLIIMLLAVVGASAQSEMAIGSLFDGRYRNNPNVTENVMKGGSLKDYDIKFYHSLTLTGEPNEAAAIERLVSRDGAKAIDKEVSYKNGSLYYGFYEFRAPKGASGYHRYLFYLNQHATGGNKIILIYIESSASGRSIRKLLK